MILIELRANMNNSKSDDEKLIAVCYSSQKLYPFKNMFPNGNIVKFTFRLNLKQIRS